MCALEPALRGTVEDELGACVVKSWHGRSLLSVFSWPTRVRPVQEELPVAGVNKKAACPAGLYFIFCALDADHIEQLVGIGSATFSLIAAQDRPAHV